MSLTPQWLLRAALTCGTILLQANQTLVDPASSALGGGGGGGAFMSSAKPWSLVSSSAVSSSRGCVAIVLAADPAASAALELTSAAAAAKTRRPARLLLPFSSAAAAATVASAYEENDRLNFEVYIALSNGNEQEAPALFRHVSPFLSDGRPRIRRLRFTHTVLRPYILYPPPSAAVGIDVDITRSLEKRIGFEAEFYFGGSYRDLMVELAHRRADVALNQPNFAIQRYSLGLDISPALTQRDMSFAKRNPVPANSFYTIAYPYSNGTWLAVFTTVVALAATIALLNKFYGFDVLSFSDVSISFVPLISESVPLKWFDHWHLPPYFPIFLLWLLMGNLLANAYKSNLLAVLVQTGHEKDPETFEDLLDQKIELYLMNNTIIPILLKYSPFEKHRRVFQECLLERGGFYTSPTEGTPQVLARVAAGKAVNIAASDLIPGIRQHYMIAKDMLSSGHAGWYFAGKMPWADRLSWGLLVLLEAGVTEQIRSRNDWIVSRPERAFALEQPSEGQTVIGVSHVLPMLTLLSLGLAFILLVILPAEVASWKAGGNRTDYMRKKKSSEQERTMFASSAVYGPRARSWREDTF